MQLVNLYRPFCWTHIRYRMIKTARKLYKVPGIWIPDSSEYIEVTAEPNDCSWYADTSEWYECNTFKSMDLSAGEHQTLMDPITSSL